VQGLKDWPPADRPSVVLPFFAFRVMVGIGFVMLGLVVAGLWLRLRRRLAAPWFLRACELAAPLGFVAVVSGWIVTETGRQPWTVYGLMRTADSVSPSLTGSDVLLSLLSFAAAYFVIFPAGIFVMARIVRGGTAVAAAPHAVESGRPASPVRPRPLADGVEP
jgi:cytochrome d ubiquinol oxidase subunit I